MESTIEITHKQFRCSRKTWVLSLVRKTTFISIPMFPCSIGRCKKVSLFSHRLPWVHSISKHISSGADIVAGTFDFSQSHLLRTHVINQDNNCKQTSRIISSSNQFTLFFPVLSSRLKLQSS